MPLLVCGLDEVGRGALAGPLIAVASLCFSGDKDRYLIPCSRAVGKSSNILSRSTWGIDRDIRLQCWETENSPVPGVNDSKKLSPKKRREVFHLLLRSEHLVDFGIGEVSVDEINAQGIDWANRTAFERAVKDLRQMPHYILIDGTNPLYGWNILDQRHKPQADGLWWPVGAASILAKVIRDSYMAELAEDFPDYAWDRNAGYGSSTHRNALVENGECLHHRTQFIRGILGRP